MENYERTTELIEVAQNSSGRASEQFAKYADTLENKLNKLKNSWEQLKLSFLNSDIFKNIVDGANKFISSLSKIDGKRLLAIGIIGMTVGKQVVKNFIQSINNSSNEIQKAFEGSFKNVSINSALGRFFAELDSKITESASKVMSEFGINIASSDTETTKLILSWVRLGEQVDKDERELMELKNKFKEADEALNQEEYERLQILQRQYTEYKKQEAKVKEILTEEQMNSVTSSPKVKGLANSAEKTDNLKLSPVGQAVGNAISGGITTAIIMALSGADFKTTMVATLGSVVTSIIPVLVQKGVEVAVGALGSGGALAALTPVLGVALGAVLIGAVGYAIYKYNSEEAKLERKIKFLDEQLEASSTRAQEASAAAEESREEYKNLEELKQKYDELNKIAYKTTEQQEEQNKLAETLQEEYPELIKSYNEETGALTVQNDLWQDKIDKARELAKLQAQTSYETKQAALLDQYDLDTQKIKEERENAQNRVDEAKKEYDTNFGLWASEENVQAVLNGEITAEEYLEYLRELDPSLILSVDDINSAVEGLKKVQAAQEELDEVNKEATAREQQYSEDLVKAQNEQVKEYLSYTGESGAIIDFLASQAEEGNLKNSQGAKNADEFLEAMGGAFGTNWVVGKGYGEKLSAKETWEAFDGKIANNFKDWDSLQKIYQDYLMAGFGIEDAEKAKEEYDKLKTTGTGQAQLFEVYKRGVAAEGLFESIDEGVLNDLNDAEKEFYTEYVNSLSDKTVEELQNISEELDKNITNEDLKDSAISLGLLQQQKVKDIFSGEMGGLDVSSLLGIDIDTFAANFSEDTAQSFAKSIQTVVDSLGSDAAESYLKSFSQIAKDNGIASEDYAKILNAVDWQSATLSNLDEFKANAVKTLKELGVTGAEDFIEEWSEIAKNANLYKDFFGNEADREAYIEEVVKKTDFYRENLSSFEFAFGTTEDTLEMEGAAAQEYIDNLIGVIDKAKDEGISGLGEVTDYYNRSGDTVIFKTKALRDVVNGAIGDTSKVTNVTRTQLQKTQDEIKELENIQKNNAIRYINGNYTRGLTKEEEKRLVTLRQEEEQYQQIIASNEEALSLIEEENAKIEAQINELTDIKNKWSEIKTGLSSINSAYSSAMSDMASNGYLSSSSIESLSSAITTLNAYAEDYRKIDLASVFIETSNGVGFANGALEQWIDEILAAIPAEQLLKEGNGELYYSLIALKQEIIATREETAKAAQDAIDNAYKDLISAQEDYNEKIKAEQEARENLQEAIDAQIEKEQALQDLYYGDGSYKSSIDPLYNLTQQYEQLTHEVTKASNALDDLHGADRIQGYKEWEEAQRRVIINLESQNKLYQDQLNNADSFIQGNMKQALVNFGGNEADYSNIDFSQFYKRIGDTFYINTQALENALMPDEMKDAFKTQIETLNGYRKSVQDNEDKITAIYEEEEAKRKANRSQYIKLENKIVETLKKQNEEEVESVKNKYDALSEADNEYLDALSAAIDKQRKLRDMANQWDDLAEKEKKLSLQQRDTSGANQKEIKKLQKDIEKDRQSLLDNAIDNIINGLKELYDLQKETRDTEIEYREEIINSIDYIEEAHRIMAGLNSVDDLIEWLKANTDDYAEMSEAAMEEELENLQETLDGARDYTAQTNGEILSDIEYTAQDIENNIYNVGETLSTEAENALQETIDNMEDAKEEAKKDIQEAMDKVEEAKQSVTKAIEDVGTALDTLREKQNAYNQALANMSNKSPENDTPEPSPLIDGTDYHSEKWVKQNSSWDNLSEDESWRQKLAQGDKWEKLRDGYLIGTRGLTLSELYNMIGVGPSQLENFLKYISSLGYHGAYNEDTQYLIFSGKKDFPSERTKGGNWKKFASGGLVDFTGPAWVDGTKSNPEAFLSAQDTERIGSAAELLASLPIFNSDPKSTNISNNIGETTINIDITIENVSSDYDVNQAVERVRQDILDITSSAGTSVILRK